MKFGAQRDSSPIVLTDEQFYLCLLGFLLISAAAIVSRFALELHQNFLSIACDTAVLQNAIVNTLHGHWLANNGLGGQSIIGAHTTFLLLAFIPFYEVAPTVDTLFVLQVIGVYSTPLPVYLIACRILGRPWMAFCIAVAALSSPMLVYLAVAPLHLETWIPALALWSYYFYLRGNAVGFGICFAMAVCCAEQAALIYVALGLALLLTKDDFAWRRRFGLASFIGGIGWLMLAVFVITPYARGSHTFDIFAYNYAELGVKSVADLPGAILANPVLTFVLLTVPARWLHVAAIVGVPMLTIFFSWRTLILLAPLPLYFLMSNKEFYLDFHGYYYSFLFFAGYVAIILFVARPKLSERFRIAFLTATLFLNIILLAGPISLYFALAGGADNGFSRTLHSVFATIPEEAAVYTPHRYSAYLSNRERFVIGDLHDKRLDFKTMLDERFPETNVQPEQIDYIVSDYLTDQCGWRTGMLSQEDMKLRESFAEALVKSGEWTTFWSENNVVILKRVGAK